MAGILLILITEYMTKPLDFLTINAETKQFYQTLDQNKQIKVVLDLPIGNTIPYSYPEARAEDMDARYLLPAATMHHKILFNGYTGFLPKSYYDTANTLSMKFPTLELLDELQQKGVDGIIVHKNEYNYLLYYVKTVQGLRNLGVPEVTQTDSLILFSLIDWSPRK